jgi:hypothetical protein
MQFFSTNNQILKNRQGSLFIRPKWTFRKKNYIYLPTKNWFRVLSSVTAKMFEHRNSGKNLNKRFEIFPNFDQGHLRFWFRPKKFKTNSCLCTFNVFMFDMKRGKFLQRVKIESQPLEYTYTCTIKHSPKVYEEGSIFFGLWTNCSHFFNGSTAHHHINAVQYPWYKNSSEHHFLSLELLKYTRVQPTQQ